MIDIVGEVKLIILPRAGPDYMDKKIFNCRGMSPLYIHGSKAAVGIEMCLNECIKKRLVPFINKYHHSDSVLFWPDLLRAHYTHQVQAFLINYDIKYVKQ